MNNDNNELIIKSIEKYDNLINKQKKKIIFDKAMIGLSSITAGLSLICSIQNSTDKTSCVIWALNCGFQCIISSSNILKLSIDKKEKKQLEDNLQYYNNCFESNNQTLIKTKK